MSMVRLNAGFIEAVKSRYFDNGELVFMSSTAIKEREVAQTSVHDAISLITGSEPQGMVGIGRI